MAAPTVRLDWVGGTQETGYYLLRYAPPAATAPLHAGALVATVNSFSDLAPLVDRYDCYILVPVGGSPPTFEQVLGISDFLCVYPGSRSAVSSPGSLSVRLNQTSTARLSWTAPGGQTSYLLVAVTFDGAPARFVTVGGAETSLVDDTGGLATCYALLVYAGADTIGNSDIVCAAPGITTLPLSPVP